MRKKDKLYSIKKANILCENLYLGNKKIPENLTNEHITFVLGIELPLTESKYISENLYTRILEEQALYENFLDTVKNFAKEKINKTIDTIHDWKDVASMFYKVITNPELLHNFAVNFWNSFVNGALNTFYDYLKKIGLGEYITIIQKIIDSVSALKGWQKFLAATAIASIIAYIIKKLKALPIEGIKAFLAKYLSLNTVKDILGKLADFKTYIGWLEPIIHGVQIFYEVIKPTLLKFKQALDFAVASGKQFQGTAAQLIAPKLVKT